MDIEKIAKTCHNVNKALCEGLEDYSQETWEDAPEWQRESAINDVTFHIDNPEAPASASHDNWMKEKVDDGWKWGPNKDAEAKTHHCIVPFEELPKEQQLKDVLFSSIVKYLKK